MNYAKPPRVPTPTETQDAMQFVYPERDIWDEQTEKPGKPPSSKVQTCNPRQSQQLEALFKRAQSAGTEKLSSNSTPAQNTRSKTANERPIKRLCEVRTIEQELFLACIETYTEVTQKPVKPSNLAKRKLPIKMLNAVLNKDTGDLMEM